MKLVLTLLAAALAVAPLSAFAQDYTEGSVLEVTSVRVKDGQWDNYMAYLKGQYKPLLEAEKKAGLILDYTVYSTTPRSLDDPNLYLAVVYPNLGAMDGLEAKVEPLSEKVNGQNRAQGEKAYGERGTMREILGTEIVRELKLK
jgi:hypothetical protein